MTQLAKVFQNGRSQAIRIPKEFRVESSEVYIEKVGDTLIIKPKREHRWDEFFDMLEDVDTSDFLEDRKDLPPDSKDIF